jgi:uncharacterized membrane protein YecN with MAPEG domain
MQPSGPLQFLSTALHIHRFINNYISQYALCLNFMNISRINPSKMVRLVTVILTCERMETTHYHSDVLDIAL